MVQYISYFTSIFHYCCNLGSEFGLKQLLLPFLVTSQVILKGFPLISYLNLHFPNLALPQQPTLLHCPINQLPQPMAHMLSCPFPDFCPTNPHLSFDHPPYINTSPKSFTALLSLSNVFPNSEIT